MDWSGFFKNIFKAGVYITPAMLTLLADKIEERFGGSLKAIDHKLDCVLGNIEPPMDLPTLALAIQEKSGGKIKADKAAEGLAILGDVLAELEQAERHAECKLIWTKGV